MACPHCHREEGQVRAGLNGDIQRYKCRHCGRRYSYSPRPRGYGTEMRSEARSLRSQGLSSKEIGARLQVSQRSIINWLRRPIEEAKPLQIVPLSEESSLQTPKQPRRRPTILDVATRAEVSTSTISNYLNKRGRMSGATEERIREAIDQLNFTPNALMRALHQHKTDILGVYVNSLKILDQKPDESIVLPILSGIYRGASSNSQNVLHFTNYERDANQTQGDQFLNGHIDGLIWLSPPIQSPSLHRLAAAGLPVVALLARHVPDSVGYVNADNIGAIGELIKHLAEIGHTRIGFIGPIHDSNFQDRLEGYRLGLEAAGLPRIPAIELLIEIEGDWRPETFDKIVGGDEPLNRWLSLSSPPTAVIIPDDGLALSFGRAVQRRGLRIPEDIAIAGFGDIPESRYAFGGMTTVRQPLGEMGQCAAERLQALIEGAPVDECQITKPAEIIIRRSTCGARP